MRVFRAPWQIVVLSVLAIPGYGVDGGAREVAKVSAEVVITEGLFAAVDLVEDGELTWERLTTGHRSSESPVEKEEKEALVNAVLDEIRSVDPASLGPSFEEFVETVRDLERAAVTLERSGGFVNYVLADRIRRRMIVCIGHRLFNHSEDVEGLEELVSGMVFPEVDVDAWVDLKREEEEVDVVVTGDEEKDLKTMASARGGRFRHIKDSLHDMLYFGRDELLWSGNVSALFHVHNNTRWWFSRHLKATVRFMHRGGKIEDLNTTRSEEVIERLGGQSAIKEFYVPGMPNRSLIGVISVFKRKFDTQNAKVLRGFLGEADDRLPSP